MIVSVSKILKERLQNVILKMCKDKEEESGTVGIYNVEVQRD